ncbi:unnamed protein product, partial [Symbiodinium sp. KB8]
EACLGHGCGLCTGGHPGVCGDADATGAPPAPCAGDARRSSSLAADGPRWPHPLHPVREGGGRQPPHD